MIHDAVVHKITRRNPSLQDWPYYGIIDVLNPVATAQYQHSVTIPTKPGMAHDFRDLRFFQADGTEIPFWNESKTDGSTSFNWFKPYSASNMQTYVFYGNREAVSQSNGDLVFEFFDDFQGTSLDTTSKWTLSAGTVSVANSIATIVPGYSAFYSKSAWGIGYAARIYSKTYSTSASTDSAGFIRVSSPYERAYFVSYSSKTTAITYDTSLVESADLGALNTFRVYEIRKASASHTYFYIDDIQKLDQTSQIATESMSIIFESNSGASQNNYVDWTLVRKYTATEPVCQLNQSGLRNPAYR